MQLYTKSILKPNLFVLDDPSADKYIEKVTIDPLNMRMKIMSPMNLNRAINSYQLSMAIIIDEFSFILYTPILVIYT